METPSFDQPVSGQLHYPVLYSFRRCPYAMRVRLALFSSRVPVKLREVKLSDKPQELLNISPKGTVPVLTFPSNLHKIYSKAYTDLGLAERPSKESRANGDKEDLILEESIDIMRWALLINDESGWMRRHNAEQQRLIDICDDDFKYHLDRYKYHTRYGDVNVATHRAAAYQYIEQLGTAIAGKTSIAKGGWGFVDMAVFPFVRQFANHRPDDFAAKAPENVRNWLQKLVGSALFSSIMVKHKPWQTGQEGAFLREQTSLNHNVTRNKI